MIKRFIGACLFLFIGHVYALDLELTQGINAALPIAINQFSGNFQAQDISTVINNDLGMSGQFKIIPSPLGHSSMHPSIEKWREALNLRLA